MSVGGCLIEIRTVTDPSTGDPMLRLWVIDPSRRSPGFGDETVVYAVPQDSLPSLGDEIWWQSGRIYFDGDRQQLVKIGYSHRPEAEVDG